MLCGIMGQRGINVLADQHMSCSHACCVIPMMQLHASKQSILHLHHGKADAVLAQVLPYWTKASLQNLAAVVCWRHAASLNPASIRVTQSADGSQDAEQELSTAFSCSRTQEKIVPLEVSQLPMPPPFNLCIPSHRLLELPAQHSSHTKRSWCFLVS